MPVAKYKHLLAWDKMLESYNWWIRDNQYRAERENAPIDAIYKDSATGRWVQFSEVTNTYTRKTINKIMGVTEEVVDV